MNEFLERRGKSAEVPFSVEQDFRQVANQIYERALSDAKGQLHPLMRNSELHQLGKRIEFVQAFKLALEKRIAQTLAVWQPDIQAVFRFDESWMESGEAWDGSIHLLVKVPRLSDTINRFSKKLDRNLTHCLKKLDWSWFQKHRSILEIQQVTPNELRHGTSYGAMFYAVHSMPVKVWSQRNQ